MSIAEEKAIEAYPVLRIYNEAYQEVIDANETKREAFAEGYEQALKDLWHDASEKPNGKDYVIAWDGKYASIARYKQVINCKWCYLEDLLPKED